jgi:hypothetical protein
MNLQTQVAMMQAAASSKPGVSTPITKHFQAAGKQLKCRLCGATCKDQNAAADHLMQGHKELNARDFSQGRRHKLAKSGAAMPDGSFPIVNKKDLKNAEHLVGHAKNPAAAKAHIRERAKALGVKAYGTSEGVSKEWDSRGRVSQVRWKSDGSRHIGTGKHPNGKWSAQVHDKKTGRMLHHSEPKFSSRSEAFHHGKSVEIKADQFGPEDRLNMPKPAGTPDRDPYEYMPGKVQGRATMLRQRPREIGKPLKKVGSCMKGSQVF